jgi:hypothetical protein
LRLKKYDNEIDELCVLDMSVIKKLASATACPILRAITAPNVKKTTGRLPVVRGAKSVLVIQ